jgi:uncharacterized protein (TIGR02145 family)/uncharacterized repeat protein (TIGR02543 family)
MTVSVPTGSTGNKNYTANWTLIAYTITFNANGGTVSPSSGTTGTGWKLASLPTPKRTCYTFNGWYTSAAGDEAVTVNTVFSSDVTVYARWTVISGCTVFTDSRDGQEYGKIGIGTQVWMAENLNYAGEESNEIGVCYDDDPANCAKYGRLYDWNTARIVCPVGWHLAERSEWAILMNYVGDSAGNKLKSSEYWEYYSDPAVVGTDDYGFSALCGGYGSDSTFSDSGVYGYWWTITRISNTSNVWYSYMIYNSSAMYLTHYNYSDSKLLFSVRCVQ